MRIRISTKLIAAFALIVMLMIALALYLMSESRKSLEESVGKSSVFLAGEMLKSINQGIYRKIEELQVHSGHLLLHKSVSESNREFHKLANIEEYIKQKDRDWVAAPKDKTTPFMQELITGDLPSHFRKDLIEFYQKKYGHKIIAEIFVTNKYGANVAQSGKTSDYRQDDEEWWQIAREKGLYVSDVEYDESSGISAISIGIRIKDQEGNFTGVMKAVLDVKRIIGEAEIGSKKYETTRIKLITRDGRLIYSTGAFKFLEDVSGRPFFKQIKGQKGSFIGKRGEKERLYSFVRSKGYKDFEGLGWILVVGHDVQEILKPVFQLRNRMTAASLVLITIVIIIAFFMSRSITKPIAKLSKSAEKIGKGDLEYRFEIKTRDEIGGLANTFNNMMAELKNVTASRDELNKEIDERKQAEERLEHLNVVLRAIRNVNQLITKEKDRDRLLQGACDNLVETRGYFSAWIALFDESRNFIAAAEAGLGENFSRLLEILERGDLMKCGREVLGRSGVLTIVNPIDVCDDCPLSKSYAGKEAMTIRLEYQGKVYGIMSVSIPKGMATDREEQLLFEEIADDIAFALFVLESEEKEKQSQEALRKSEEFNKRIIENSIDCITILDLDGRLEFMSEGGQKLMEIEDISPYLNQPWIDLLTCSDDSYKAVLEAISKTKEGDVGHFHGYCPTEKGTEKWWDIIISPIMGKDGKVERLLSVSRDITEHKRLEDQFRQVQKMEAIGTLAGGIAHDFNNLLTAILGNAQLALMNVIKDESLRMGIEEIKKAGERAASLTRQLLAFSRKQIIKPKILDINEVINETKNMLKRMIGEDIEFLMVLEPELWKVYTDPGQIDQVVMNLVVNARDAMPRGGKLTIETANVELDGAYFLDRGVENEPGPYVVLAVTDNGTGMDKETQSRIFDPFFTTKEIGSGTGLGLSTVYGIVKQNNGYVWVYSEPGKGTTFKIYFPRVAEDVVIAGKEQEEFAGEISGSETVLIVEDDDALRNITKKILQKYGYKILEAENGEKALNIGETHEGPIHLLLTDVVMPGMSGSELSEKMQSIRPETQVIYMSGYTDNAIVRHGILRQGINFIEKPFSPEGLGKKVRQALDSKN